MDEILQLTLLYDFYGELLTEKQKQVYEMHHLDDFTLTEIGEELSISRQAVRDQLKRTEKILIAYEEKLHLVERFHEQQLAFHKIKEILDQISTKEIDANMGKSIAAITKIAEEILS